MSDKVHIKIPYKKAGRPRIDPHKCSSCDYITKKTTDLKAHILANHSTIEERRSGYKFYCQYCDIGCFSEINYTKHLHTNRHLRIVEAAKAMTSQ